MPFRPQRGQRGDWRGRRSTPREEPIAASAPDAPDLPAAARRHLAAGEAACVWNPYATSTWRIAAHRGGGARYLKAGWTGAYPSLAGERDRLAWLRARGAPVPEVLDHGAGDGVEWLLTAALDGEPAVAPQRVANARATVRSLAAGLRAFHAIDPAGCPFDHRVAATLAHVRDRVRRGDVDPAGFHDDHRHHTPSGALAVLERHAPAREDVVVTHGDYCFPNVLLRRDRVVGYLDVGEAGLGDRWRDLALATWSTTWNVGPGFEALFLEAYGIARDEARMRYYRLLYDLES